MPVMPGYANADAPHERTVHLASKGWRYGCHSARTGDTSKRGGWVEYTAHPWSKRGMKPIATTWLPIPCGHTTRATDAACEGCVNRGEK